MKLTACMLLLLASLAACGLQAQPGVLFQDDFSTDKGWQLPSPWSRDVATAFSQASPPMFEPGTDNTPTTTDNRIIGDTIGNVYAANDGSVHWAVSPVIDCSGSSVIYLNYSRVLGLANGSSANIEVTNNGTTWTSLWSSPAGSTIYESAWTWDTHDISVVAAGSTTVQVRFGIGPTGAAQHTGWCIDDVSVYAPPIIQVNLGSAAGPQISHQQSPFGTGRDFGNQDINAGPTAAITIFITNIGTGSLSLSTPSMGGTWWTEYIIGSAGFQSQLAGGASTSFTVSFDPNTIGQKQAFARIPHTDGTQASPFYVLVTGNGTSGGVPVLEVHEGSLSGPVVAHNAAVSGGRNFGNQPIGGGPTADLTITVENSGGAYLTLGAPVLGGANPGEFVLNTSGLQSSLAPGQNTSFTAAFDPTSGGAKAAQVTFTHNDTSVTSPFIINVAGTAVAAATELRMFTQPTNSPAGQLFATAPSVMVTDTGGVVDVTDNTTTIQVAITPLTGSASASLSGTLTVTVTGGFATFSDLAISHAGRRRRIVQ
jgi:hypothetical protein